MSLTGATRRQLARHCASAASPVSRSCRSSSPLPIMRQCPALPAAFTDASRHFSQQNVAAQSTGGGSDYQLGPAQDVQPQPTTQSWGDEEGPKDGKGKSKESDKQSKWGQTAHRMFESAATTSASLLMLGLAGYGYHKYYKHLVLQKIDGAFEPGDPALTLASTSRSLPSSLPEDYSEERWIIRDEQTAIDAIVAGHAHGHYFLLVGEKGTGKTSMILEAMHKIDGHNVSMLEAHADQEIFRIRLGKALDFEFHEDYIGSLFSIRGPRDTTALLDIERAFNKLEKVALQRRERYGKPVVLIVNAMHLVRDDEDGRDLLELLQQRAEAWAASGLCTMIFNSDDYWVYERLKQYGTRMEVISVRDLPPHQAMSALTHYRQRYHQETPPIEVLEEVYKLVGGRLSYLNRVARSKDMMKKCHDICTMEKTWLLNQCGILGMEMDDDVMDQQKFASAAMVLCKALVEKEKEGGLHDDNYDPKIGHQLPEIPLHEAREIMTRADFIQQYDHINIFTIDSHAMVRADSVPMQIAMREICAEPQFNKFLEATLDRISDIESLGRTRELVFKELLYGGKYDFLVKTAKGYPEKNITFTSAPGSRPDADDEEEEEDETKRSTK